MWRSRSARKAGAYTPISACSSGTEAVARAWRLITAGEADAVVCGGVEGYIHEVPIASFSMLRAMSTRNDEPERASRPFDRDRDGFVFGEAGALLILESEAHARSRGAQLHARVLGAGVTSDGYHIVAPGPDGDGAARAMRKAIRAAGLRESDIAHVNYENPDPDIDLDIVAGNPRSQRIDYALTNSIGFGGHNAALVLSRP
jgi:beta-ketoacyl ACP synthase